MLQNTSSEHADLYHLSMQIVDQTIEFMVCAGQFSQDAPEDAAEYDALYQKAGAIDALSANLVDKTDAEIYTAMGFIAQRCAELQQWALWNHIYGKLMHQAQQASTNDRQSSLCLMPVNISAHASYSGKSFRLRADERAELEKSLHDYGLLPSHVKVRILSDLLSPQDMTFSPALFQHLARTVLCTPRHKDIDTPTQWRAALDPHNITIPPEQQAIVENRFIVVALFDAQNDDYGDLQRLWNTIGDEEDNEDVPADLQDRSDAWYDYVTTILPEALLPEASIPEPLPLAIHSAAHLQNMNKLIACLGVLDLEGADVYCLASHYGDFTTLLPGSPGGSAEKEMTPQSGPFGIMLHLYRKDQQALIDILPYERVNAEFMLPEEMEAFRALLEEHSIEFRGWLSQEQKKLCS